MLTPAAIKNYLNRPLANYNWIKACTPLELAAELNALKPKPNLSGLQLWEHQKALFLLCTELQRFMVFSDMGSGKSLIMLLLLRYRKQCGEKPKAIIFVPYRTSVETWIDETAKHTPELKCVALNGTTKFNRNLLQNVDGDLFVICYQSAVAMMKHTLLGKDGKTHWAITAPEVRQTFDSFDMIVMDEVHKVKNPRSLTYKLCRGIAYETDWAFGLTGTPFGRDLLDLWAQFNVIDFGETLGPTLGLYREVFFDAKVNYWGGLKFKFKKKLHSELTRLIKNRSLRYELSECYDMPAKRYIPKPVSPTPEIRSYYNTCVLQFREYHDQRDRSGEKLSWMQLRQVASGFITLHNDDGTKTIVDFKDNPKLEALLEIIDATPPQAKVVVFHDFVHTNHLLSDALTREKIGHARIWGGQTDPIGELRRFRNQKKCKVLLLNSQSGSSSLNLQNANYIVFFEQPASAINRTQAEHRCWRPGQQDRVFIIDLHMSGTNDASMYQANKAGKDLLKLILDGKAKLELMK